MKKRVLAVAWSAAVPLLAAEPAGFVVWPAAELKDHGREARAEDERGEGGVRSGWPPSATTWP